MTAIVRVGYCENCHKDRRPKRGQMFIYPAEEQWFVGYMGKCDIGITPHLYLLIRANEKFVYYKKICLVCGVKRTESDDKIMLSIDEAKMSGIIKTTTTNWNALVMLKDF